MQENDIEKMREECKSDTLRVVSPEMEKFYIKKSRCWIMALFV